MSSRWVSERLLTSVHPRVTITRGTGIVVRGILAAREHRPRAAAPPVVARDTGESHRAATPLELLFDLVFVVAIASNAAQLHHGLSDAHYEAVVGYSMTWFAIWWAWMNYTWFASAYDNDDVVFRPAHVRHAARFSSPRACPTSSRTASRWPSSSATRSCGSRWWGWLRRRRPPERRQTALWYAGGITVVQPLWIARLAVEPGSPWLVASFVVLAAAELVVPVLAERGHGYRPSTHHIAPTMQLADDHRPRRGHRPRCSRSGVEHARRRLRRPPRRMARGRPAVAGSWAIAPLILGGLLVVFALSVASFLRDHATIVENPRAVWLFRYGHLPIFASVAAVEAALAAGVDVVEGVSDAGVRPIALTLAVAITVVALTLSGLHTTGSRETVGTMLPKRSSSRCCASPWRSRFRR